MGILDGPNNKILKADTKVQEALEALADHVDHGAKRISRARHVYQTRNPREVQTVKVDGAVYGYRLEDHKIFMRRVIFLKVPGYRWDEISEEERAALMVPIFNVFAMAGGRKEVKHIAVDCLLFEFDFIPEIAVERKPGLVSIVGGFGGKGNA